MDVILICVCLAAAVVGAIGLKGNDVIFKQQINLIEAISDYKRHFLRKGEYEKVELVSWDIKNWNLIDCVCPWRWYYDNWVSQEQLDLLEDFLVAVIEREIR